MKKLYIFIWILCLLLSYGDLRAQQTGSETSVLWGYCNDEIATAVGAGNRMKLSGAIYVPAEVAALYQNDLIKSIHIGLSSDVTELSVFITPELNAPQTVKQEVGTGISGWNEITLESPYVITDKGFYVGYTCIGKNQLGVSNLFSENGNWIGANEEWENYASS